MRLGTGASAPRRFGRSTPRPVIDLPGRDAGEPGEGGLADIGAGEEGGEFGVQEGAHGASTIEASSIRRASRAVREPREA